MQTTSSDTLRLERWRTTKRKIRLASAGDRHKLLLNFINEIRTITPLAAKASRQKWDINACLEMAPVLGVAICGWMAAEPLNPEWPGRDRFFLTRKNDALPACCALSCMGFFRLEQVAGLIDAFGDNDAAVIPGLETPGGSVYDVISAAWESALDSTRSKRCWREQFADPAGTAWAKSSWRDFSGVWRTCILLDYQEEELAFLRALPWQASEKASGLIALVLVSKNDAPDLAAQWRESGWDTLTVGRSDSFYLFESMTAPAGGKPLLIALTMDGIAQINTAESARRHYECNTLLGELSDDQFNALMDESLNLF